MAKINGKTVLKVAAAGAIIGGIAYGIYYLTKRPTVTVYQLSPIVYEGFRKLAVEVVRRYCMLRGLPPIDVGIMRLPPPRIAEFIPPFDSSPPRIIIDSLYFDVVCRHFLVEPRRALHDYISTLLHELMHWEMWKKLEQKLRDYVCLIPRSQASLVGYCNYRIFRAVMECVPEYFEIIFSKEVFEALIPVYDRLSEAITRGDYNTLPLLVNDILVHLNGLISDIVAEGVDYAGQKLEALKSELVAVCLEAEHAAEGSVPGAEVGAWAYSTAGRRTTELSGGERATAEKKIEGEHAKVCEGVCGGVQQVETSTATGGGGEPIPENANSVNNRNNTAGSETSEPDEGWGRF